jgi:hypothetical protein
MLTGMHARDRMKDRPIPLELEGGYIRPIDPGVCVWSLAARATVEFDDRTSPLSLHHAVAMATVSERKNALGAFTQCCCVQLHLQ